MSTQYTWLMWATALHGIYESVLIKFIFMTYLPVRKKACQGLPLVSRKHLQKLYTVLAVAEVGRLVQDIHLFDERLWGEGDY